MANTSFHTTFSTIQFLFSRAKNGSESGLRSAVSYRFGFNGQEMDNEISGQTGTHTTAMFWEYDSRLGRRWNVDPVLKQWESPYLCFSGNPIWYSDPAGDNAGHWLTRSGKDLGDDGRPDDNTYVVDDDAYSETFNNASAKELRDKLDANNGISMGSVAKLSLTWTSFQKMRNWANGEIGANDSKDALYALNSAIVNWSNYEKKDLSTFLDSKLNAKFNSWYSTNWTNSSAGRQQTANAAAINSLLGGHDYSNGAIQWDGKEQATKFDGTKPSYSFINSSGNTVTWYSKVYAQGWSISNEHYTTWMNAIKKEGGNFIAPQQMAAKATGFNNNKIRLYSSACYGTTIFWVVK